MQKIILSLLSVVALLSFAHAGDHYRINNANSLICRYRSDLQTFILLNKGKSKAAVRALYKTLQSQDRLMNAQPGDEVEVIESYDDGTAQINFNGHIGFIAKADLSMLLGSDQTQAQNQ